MKRDAWQALVILVSLSDEEALAAVRDVLWEARGTAMLAEALAPPKLLYAEDRDGCTEVRCVDLAGVVIEPPSRRDERVWTYREDGIEIPLPDYEGRIWTEEIEPGVAVPLGSQHILDWARERVGHAIRSDRAVEILGVLGLTVPAFLSAVAGQGDLAMIQAHAAAFVGCIVGLVQAATA